jgi:hypothetical protein
MSSPGELTRPTNSLHTPAGLQEFTWEQLQRIESAVNFVLVSTGGPRTLGTVVKDVLRTQDFMGALKSGRKSSSIGFLELPAETRNKIYRYCLVVGEVYPRSDSHEDERMDDEVKFQQPQTRIFELCRQIFAEAAPLYFAENKFVLSHGNLPWPHSFYDQHSKPITKVAHQNLRSLSITFDVRDAQILPSDLQANRSDGDHSYECGLWEKWRGILKLVKHLDLQLLEFSLRNCYCAFCHRSLTGEAVVELREAIRFSPRVVLKGLLNSDEVSSTRKSIKRPDVGFRYQDIPSWHPKFDDEDPSDADSDDEDSDDEFQVAFQVVKD